MTETPYGISLNQAGLRFGPQVVFDDLTLTLEAGKITCLLGPSGVGKSSLLRLLAGLSPKGGEITGERSAIAEGATPPLENAVAYMAQTDLLLPWAKVLDNVTIGRKLRREAVTTADRDRALNILDQVGLSDVAADLPATLSGGMRQRVALARTLFEDRPVVLMDEPFSALDAITRRNLQQEAVTHLAGKTVLLVTHDPMEALRVGHVIHVLNGQPARLSDKIIPNGTPPRDEGSEGIWDLYQDLLTRLSGAEVPYQ